MVDIDTDTNILYNKRGRSDGSSSSRFNRRTYHDTDTDFSSRNFSVILDGVIYGNHSETSFEFYCTTVTIPKDPIWVQKENHKK